MKDIEKIKEEKKVIESRIENILHEFQCTYGVNVRVRSEVFETQDMSSSTMQFTHEITLKVEI